MTENEVSLPVEQGSKLTFSELVADSQRQYREVERGILSRPVEFPRQMVDALDRTVKGVFTEVVDSNYPKPIVTWGGLFDDPNSPKPYWFDIRIPETVTPEDKNEYSVGIQFVNEWATNFFTKELMAKGFLKHPVLQPFGRALGSLMDGGGSAYKPAYDMMKLVQQSGADPTQFEQALKKAYFSHEAEELDQLILQSGVGENISQLATAVGRATQRGGKKGFVEVLMDGVAYHEKDTKFQKLARRIGGSFLGLGRNTYPGVVELSLASPALLTLAPIATPQALPIGLLNAAMVGFTLSHETVHAYSKDLEQSGLIPVTLVKNPKVTS